MVRCRAVLCLAVAVAVSLLSAQFAEAATSLGVSGLKEDYYKGKCGDEDVETIIYKSMKKSFDDDSGIAPGILRIVFHDCFVRVSNPIIRSFRLNQ